MENKTGLTIGIIVLAVIVVGGVGYALQKNTSTSTSSTPTPSASATATTTDGVSRTTVRIQNFAFTNADISVRVGDTVEWTNNDSAAHTVNSTNGGPLNSGSLAAGGTYSYTFTAAGTYPYKCNFHPSMLGTVTVQ